MSDFTYTVFLIVALSIASLAALLAAGVIGVLFYDTYHQAETPATPEPAELPRAA